MRPIAILTAVPQEFEALEGLAEIHAARTVGDVQFLSGRLDDMPVEIAQCGIGKVNAAFAATVLLDRLDCAAIIFCGVAGSLDPDLHVGDVIVAERLIQHDYGTLRDGAFWPAEPGRIPVAQPDARHAGYELDPALRTQLVAALADVTLPALGLAGRIQPPALRFGTILTGDTFLNCAETRASLQALHAADGIEMEGAAVAQVAAKFGAPWVVIRTISDEANGGSHVDFPTFARLAAANSAALAPRVVAQLNSRLEQS